MSVQHAYVSSYDPEDYSKLGEHASPQVRAQQVLGVPPALANPHVAQGWTRGWKMVPTTEGIFTSIVVMGIEDRDPTEAVPDYGCQYELRIWENNLIEVFGTPGLEQQATKVVQKQAKPGTKKSIQ